MPASMPRRWMKASIALLSPLALLLIQALFLRHGVGKTLFVDQIDVPADTTQVANGGADRGFQRSVILNDNAGPDLDRAICMGELYRAPRGLEPTRRPRCHTGQRGRNLRDDPRRRKVGFQADIVDLARSQEAKEAAPRIRRTRPGIGVDVDAPRCADQHSLVREPLHHQFEVGRVDTAHQRRKAGRCERPDTRNIRLSKLLIEVSSLHKSQYSYQI